MVSHKKNPPLSIKNKKATFLYTIEHTYTTGISLKGTEVKAIRQGKAHLTDAYCYFQGHELWAKGLHISPYSLSQHDNHPPERPRKLLLNKNELKKLKTKQQEKGYTLIILELFNNPNNLLKLKIALAKGKKLHDKRQSIKEKELKRTLAKEAKNS